MCFSNVANKRIFSHKLKYVDNKPMDKKVKKQKRDYRPKRILQDLFELFERCMHDQLNDYSQNIMTGFEKVLAQNIA